MSRNNINMKNKALSEFYNYLDDFYCLGKTSTFIVDSFQYAYTKLNLDERASVHNEICHACNKATVDKGNVAPCQYSALFRDVCTKNTCRHLYAKQKNNHK